MFLAMILVTGATGRVGSRFARRLVAEGEPVRALVRRGEVAGAETVVGDLREAESRRRALDGVDAVVHLAAAFRGVADEEALAVNHDATVALAREAGARRFVYASTNLVYGAGRGRPAREDDEPAPAGAYPESKAASERVLRELGARIVRLAFVYGEGDPHLAESMMWARRWPAHQRLQLVHHADVAQGLLRALRTEGIDGATFNIADDAPATAAELHALNGDELAADAAERPLEDPWAGIVDTSAARRVLGWRPIFPSVYTARDAGAF
jgi:nucleoside-diphosphate-sugar epimerase